MKEDVGKQEQNHVIRSAETLLHCRRGSLRVGVERIALHKYLALLVVWLHHSHESFNGRARRTGFEAGPRANTKYWITIERVINLVLLGKRPSCPSSTVHTEDDRNN